MSVSHTWNCTVVTLQRAGRRVNLTYVDGKTPQEEHSGLEMETLSQLCSHASQEPTYENMRHINNVISKAKIGNPFSIQPEASKLLVETFWCPALQQYLDKRKLLEQKGMEKTSQGPLKPVLNDGFRPNHNTPPITRTQYPHEKATANATLLHGIEDTDFTDEDDDN